MKDITRKDEKAAEEGREGKTVASDIGRKAREFILAHRNERHRREDGSGVCRKGAVIVEAIISTVRSSAGTEIVRITIVFVTAAGGCG